MHPKVFLQVAKEWAENAPECEGHTRSSISRAYYAAFHSCRDTVENLGIPQESHFPSHKRVIEALRTSGDQDLSKLSKKLKDLKVMREAADYDIDYRLPQQNKILSLRKAERIIEECAKKVPSSNQRGT
ncbi:HEPN domain-containing protein [Marinobacter shengliensis]